MIILMRFVWWVVLSSDMLSMEKNFGKIVMMLMCMVLVY